MSFPYYDRENRFSEYGINILPPVYSEPPLHSPRPPYDGPIIEKPNVIIFCRYCRREIDYCTCGRSRSRRY